MMRSQTDEQLAARWDKEPYVSNGRRFATHDEALTDAWHNGNHGIYFDPRPECIPSRWRTEVTSDGYGPNGYPRVRIPRPPVNPILVEYREDSYPELHRYPAVWLADLIEQRGPRAFTPEQIDHARKVLTRLAALA
jgi:hypothetical protein